MVAVGLAAIIVLDNRKAFARAVQVIFNHAVTLALVARHHNFTGVDAFELHPVDRRTPLASMTLMRSRCWPWIVVFRLAPHAAGDQLEVGLVAGRGGGSCRHAFAVAVKFAVGAASAAGDAAAGVSCTVVRRQVCRSAAV